MSAPQTLREAQEAEARALFTLGYDRRRVLELRAALDEAIADEARAKQAFDTAHATVVRLERPYGS